MASKNGGRPAILHLVPGGSKRTAPKRKIGKKTLPAIPGQPGKPAKEIVNPMYGMTKQKFVSLSPMERSKIEAAYSEFKTAVKQSGVQLKAPIQTYQKVEIAPAVREKRGVPSRKVARRSAAKLMHSDRKYYTKKK